MGYADRDPPPAPPAEPDLLERAAGVVGLLVRLIGVALLCVGIAVALKVIGEAFQLYERPQTIERFAEAIEAGSNLDAVLTSAVAGTSEGGGRATAPSLRLSYFAAWGVVLMLLLVVSGIAMSVIVTGGRLALGALRLKRGR